MAMSGTNLMTVIFGESESELFIGGFNKDFFNSRLHYVARLDDNGSISWEYYHNFLTFPPYHYVARLKYSPFGYLFGCSEA